VEQLRDPIGSNQDVPGLDIAVHNQVLVCVLHRVADLPEQAQTLLHRQFLLLAPDVDWNARDILQHDVWRALFGSAAVEEAGDIGVFQMGQDLALVSESRYSRTANQLELECFDSDLFLELIVSANGQIDGAHSALAQWPHNPVGTHAAAHPA